jgi:hypothetical protein
MYLWNRSSGFSSVTAVSLSSFVVQPRQVQVAQGLRARRERTWRVEGIAGWWTMPRQIVDATTDRRANLAGLVTRAGTIVRRWHIRAGPT